MPTSNGMSSWFQNVFSRTSLKRLPDGPELVRIVRSLSIKERLFLYGMSLLALVSFIVFFHLLGTRFFVQVPARGGTLFEGIVGVPHFINPLLANSDADKDLVTLVYSGLLRPGPNGTYLPDLAESYTISEDGQTYHFTLRKGITFHDGSPITSDDVAFTIRLAQDKNIKSPRLPNWEGVTVETPDAQTVDFILKKAYAPFLENTTLGILPKTIWQQVSSEEFGYSIHNTMPIGSGPYMMESIDNDKGGVPTAYNLRAFKKFALGKPYIERLRLVFYPTEEKLTRAYLEGVITSAAGLSPETLIAITGRGMRIEETPLPRVFGLFFNQNEATVLVDRAVREALASVIDQREIVQNVLAGYGVALTGPLPPHTVDSSSDATTATHEVVPLEARIAKARGILTSAGWKYNEETKLLEKTVKKQTSTINLSIATINAPELKQVAELVASAWRAVGITIEVHYYEYGDLTQNIIRPRKFNVLLFGEIVGRFPDLYAFWHSSQRLDPGLNIAEYTNLTVDKNLNDVRKNTSREGRAPLHASIEAQIAKDIPAIFLYAPSLTYILPKNLGGLDLSGVSTPSERFLSIYQWYLETDGVWKIFAPQTK